MRFPFPADRREPGRTSLSRAAALSLPRWGNDGRAFWLSTTAFLVVVALTHALFIGVALFQSVEAIPIAHRAPQRVGIITAALLRMVTLVPAIALLRLLHHRFGFVSTPRSFVCGGVTLFVVAVLEWWLFLASMTLLDRWRGTDGMTFVPTYPYGIGYRVVVLGLGMLFFALATQWQRLKSLELRAAEAEAALRMSELTRLEAQLQPHFLFNALTAVLACRHDPEAVASVTIGLSEHLRSCLSRQRKLEPLSR